LRERKAGGAERDLHVREVEGPNTDIFIWVQSTKKIEITPSETERNGAEGKGRELVQLQNSSNLGKKIIDNIVGWGIYQFRMRSTWTG